MRWGIFIFTKKNIIFSFSIIARRFKRQRARLVADRRVNFFFIESFRERRQASAAAASCSHCEPASRGYASRRAALQYRPHASVATIAATRLRSYNSGHTPPLLQHRPHASVATIAATHFRSYNRYASRSERPHRHHFIKSPAPLEAGPLGRRNGVGGNGGIRRRWLGWVCRAIRSRRWRIGRRRGGRRRSGPIGC